MNNEQMSPSERFMVEYGGQLSKLDPGIIQNPAFKRLVEQHISKMIYADGVSYTWGTIRDPETDEPAHTPMLPHEVSLKVSEDGKTLTVTRNATPFRRPGMNIAAMQAGTYKITLLEDGNLEFLDSNGYTMPNKGMSDDNFSAWYSYQQFDKKGNEIVRASFGKKTHLNLAEVSNIEKQIVGHCPKFSAWGIDEQNFSFYGKVEYARHVRRNMLDPATNYIQVKGKGDLIRDSHSLGFDETFTLLDFNGEHIERFPADVDRCRQDTFSPEFIMSGHSTPEHQAMYERKHRELNEILASQGLIQIDSQELESTGRGR